MGEWILQLQQWIRRLYGLQKAKCQDLVKFQHGYLSRAKCNGSYMWSSSVPWILLVDNQFLWWCGRQWHVPMCTLNQHHRSSTSKIERLDFPTGETPQENLFFIVVLALGRLLVGLPNPSPEGPVPGLPKLDPLEDRCWPWRKLGEAAVSVSSSDSTNRKHVISKCHIGGGGVGSQQRTPATTIRTYMTPQKWLPQLGLFW